VAGRRSVHAALVVAAIGPAVTGVWATWNVFANPEPRIFEFTWVEALDLVIRFRTDSVALLMTAIVSGIGALVFVYATGYFSPGSSGGGRFAASLLAFSTSMLGLVLADSIWTLFIFWELTSVTSFLLVGHKDTKVEVQQAARRALMITGGGGLALLAGLLLLGQSAGTTILTDLVPATGTSGHVSALLILTAVATKSAQVPFHVWLPGAMAAPTPVSAYLHSATMVKAGVLLMALTSSAFVDIDAWKVVGLTLGIMSMLWGGIGALRHVDAKLILAWGTVSQLGLLVTLLALGSGKSMFAAISMLVAHALFKATLFLIVGEIDVRTGTRDISELGGLFKTMPFATGAAVLAGLSMAGAPPLLGFTTKEAAIEATLGMEGVEKVIAVGAVGLGAVFTVAYTTRFLWCVFGPGPDTPVAERRLAMTLPASFLALTGVAGFIALDHVTAIVSRAATELNEKSSVYALLRWPGITTAFLISMSVLVLGVGLAALLIRRTQTSSSPATGPEPRGAKVADQSLDGILALSRRVTRFIQHGSLPVYVATMSLTAAVATIPFFTDLGFDHIVWWDQPLQMVLAMAVSLTALASAFVTSRLGAALSLGAVGIGVSGLFVVHGAPDLALTQLLIETIIVVGFVTGLGHLNRQFPRIANTWRSVRLAVSLLVGVAVMGALAAATASPSGQAPLEDLVRLGVETGGGNNIVNVILTDMRALDTLGEVVVLAVVALGIAALATSSQPTSQDKAPNDKAPDDKASDNKASDNKAQQEVAT
jgi:multicomponent Na+:H+ antiporter subunit A